MTKRALVLSGGGARGAYEAGVLRYIIEELPKELGHAVEFDIISGTSVGAINATWTAATIDDPDFCVQRLWFLWRDLVFRDVVKLSFPEIWRNARRLVDPKLGELDSIEGGRIGGVLDTSYFDDLIHREVPFEKLDARVASGRLHALTLSTTDLATGRTAIFAHSREPLPPWTRDPRRYPVAGPIRAEMVLASAAIPLLFPAVEIAGRWFCDGGLRQNTPLAPAVRMGADKVLVITLKSRCELDALWTLDAREASDVRYRYPDIWFILGKVMNSLLLDPVDYDLAVLRRINGVLEGGQAIFGDDDFVAKLNGVVRRHRGKGYRHIEPLLISPSQNIGKLACAFALDQPRAFWGNRFWEQVCKRAANAESKESDLLSYVLFDGEFTGGLLELGYHDARARHDDLVAFFRDEAQM